jgi:hypothetical protein
MKRTKLPVKKLLKRKKKMENPAVSTRETVMRYVRSYNTPPTLVEGHFEKFEKYSLIQLICFCHPYDREFLYKLIGVWTY